MVFAVAVLLFQFPTALAAGNSLQHATAQPASDTRASAAAVASGPAKTSPAASATSEDHSKSTSQPLQALLTEPTGTSPISGLYLPPPPAFRPPDETTVTQPKWWIMLSATEHGSATFDAWSTRNALSNGRVEADPVMRPFAGSSAIYGAIQVIPLGLDYLARRFQRSAGWTRHIWWAPQSVATATFLFSGSYNVAHAN